MHFPPWQSQFIRRDSLRVLAYALRRQLTLDRNVFCFIKAKSLLTKFTAGLCFDRNRTASSHLGDNFPEKHVQGHSEETGFCLSIFLESSEDDTVWE